MQKNFVHDVTELIHVTVNGELIHTTPNHLFYVEGAGFKRADELKVGDRVRLLNGEIKKVDRLEAESLKHPVKVFNFRVADWHDYYVGTQGVLVHNANNGKTCGVTGNETSYGKSSEKTYQTYTKTNPSTGEVYSGRTSGYGSPVENVRNRDAKHHMNSKGFGPAVLDETSSDYNAIRGREQMLIDKYGHAKSVGGTSGNAINGIGKDNKKKSIYLEAAKKIFGDLK